MWRGLKFIHLFILAFLSFFFLSFLFFLFSILQYILDVIALYPVVDTLEGRMDPPTQNLVRMSRLMTAHTCMHIYTHISKVYEKFINHTIRHFGENTHVPCWSKNSLRGEGQETSVSFIVIRVLTSVRGLTGFEFPTRTKEGVLWFSYHHSQK